MAHSRPQDRQSPSAAAAALPLVLSLVLSAGCVPAGPGGTATSDPAGMVSSAHALATEAGIEILEAGGNAFDATVAVAAALNVVEPMMSGMGGYGTILVYSAGENRSRFLNASGRIPRGVVGDAYRAPTPGYMENRRGAKAVSTPGNLNAWAAMHDAYGVLPWPDLLAPAIRLAREGFVVDERTASLIEEAWEDFDAHPRSFYGTNGRPLREGERLIQEELAQSLEMVAARGPEALHGGPLGEAVDRTMRETGGFLRLVDLAENEAEWWDPIEVDYRGNRVITASPPANSFPALVRLGIMSRFDVGGMGHNSVEYLHTFAEASKHGFWTRLRWAGDPEIAPPPLELLLSEAYWGERAAAIDPVTASEFVPPGAVGATGANTTHFVVADGEGNVVSATQTLGNSFGSRIMAEGTGIWLNNSLAYSTFEPAGNPMDAYPGRRKLSGDVPLFVADDLGRPWLAVGTPGGHTIGQTVPQIVMNVLDFGMDIQAAIAAPRISFVEPDVIIEDGLPADVVDALSAMGHRMRSVPGIGNAHGLVVRWGTDGVPEGFEGGADPRGVGTARGLEPSRGSPGGSGRE